MPAKVDDLFKEIKKDNPSYSDEQAWATAWSVFCKHVSPGSDHCSKPPSEYLKGKSAGLIVRVAARYAEELTGMEHSSPEARKHYLEEHPHADPSNHTVKEKEKSEEEEAADKMHPLERKLADKVKGWGAKAIGFLKKAPEQVKKFVADEGFRRECLMSAHKTLTEAPAKMTHAVIETAKHEVHEFKEAGAGIKAVLGGGKMSDSQKHAFKTVATHMAIGLAAAALTASGPLGIAGAFGKGMARHIAFKAASSALGHLHVLDELGHIGHGIQHIFDKLAAEAKDADPDQVMANLVAAVVAKELEKLNDDDVKAVAESMDEDGEKDEGAVNKKEAHRVRRIVARFETSLRLVEAKTAPDPDLYRKLQPLFARFQGAMFNFASLAEKLPDGPDQDKALDLIADVPSDLDGLIGLPQAELLGKFTVEIPRLKTAIDMLEELLSKVVGMLPAKLQKVQSKSIQMGMKVVRLALSEIERSLTLLAEDMSEPINKGDQFVVHMKHGDWWSEMKRGLVLEARDSGKMGDTLRFEMPGWTMGEGFPMIPTKEKGKIVLRSPKGPRALTVIRK